MGPEPPQRISYLLRIWKVPDSQGGHWRALLENPMTGQRIGFENMASLTNFLLTLTCESPASQHSQEHFG